MRTSVLNFESSHIVARERHRDFVARSARDHIASMADGGALPLARRVARPLGRQLLRLSLALLRYGQAEAQPTITYRPSVGSVELN
jgi:hypothetical protein